MNKCLTDEQIVNRYINYEPMNNCDKQVNKQIKIGMKIVMKIIFLKSYIK